MASAVDHYQRSEQELASANLTNSAYAIDRAIARAAVHAQLAVAGALLEAKGATGDDTAPTA